MIQTAPGRRTLAPSTFGREHRKTHRRAHLRDVARADAKQDLEQTEQHVAQRYERRALMAQPCHEQRPCDHEHEPCKDGDAGRGRRENLQQRRSEDGAAENDGPKASEHRRPPIRQTD